MSTFSANFCTTHVGASFWDSERKIKYVNTLILLYFLLRTIFPVPEAPKNKIWICVDFGRFSQFSNIFGASWWDPEKAPRVGFEPTRDFGCPALLRAFGALPLDHSRACGFKGVHIAVMCGRTLGFTIIFLMKIHDFDIFSMKMNYKKSTRRYVNWNFHVRYDFS